MTQGLNATEQATRTKEWTLRMYLFEEGDVTKVHAVLHTDDNTLECRTTAQRNPHDVPVAEIGDEFAAGRALIHLGNQLVSAGYADAADKETGS